jgi:hypothetical protein
VIERYPSYWNWLFARLPHREDVQALASKIEKQIGSLRGVVEEQKKQRRRAARIAHVSEARRLFEKYRRELGFASDQA